MLPSLQFLIIFLLSTICTNQEAPPGYVKPPEPKENNPPKYEYGYNIEDEKGTGQGKLESRDGIYALGRYYVQGTKSSQNVQYYADDWGFHPYVEYSSVGPHSKARTSFILGTEALKALQNNKSSVNPKQQITANIDKINEKDGNENRIRPKPDGERTEQAQTVAEQPPQFILQQQLPHEKIIVPEQQQQTVYIENEQQNIVGQPHQQDVLVTQDQPQQAVVYINSEQDGKNIGASSQSEQPAVDGEQEQKLILVEQPQENVAIQQEEPKIVVQQPQQIIEQVYQQQQPEQVIVQQTQIQENLVAGQADVEQDQKQQVERTNQYETGALFKNPHSSVVGSQEMDYDESLSQQHFAGFGAKLNANNNDRANSFVIHNAPTKLIQNTRNLISGQDVLNINRAVTENSININHDSNTAKSIVSEYKSNVEHETKSDASKVDVNSETLYPTTTTTTTTAVTSTSAVDRLVGEGDLIKEPIVVADLEESSVVTGSTENYENHKEQSEYFETTQPATVLVTPRPVSVNFLAPITAGVQLQHVEGSERVEQIQKQNYLVDIQKSVPYYLGKFEYVQNGGDAGAKESASSNADNYEIGVIENLELGKTLLNFPVEPSKVPLIGTQELPSPIIRENFIESDQQQAGLQHNVAVQQVVVEKPVPYAVVQTKFVEKPVEVTKIVGEPYPVEVPIHVPVSVPYAVEKPVAVPVAVEKIVERPVTVTKFVERPIAVPQPYPVEKIVERPVHVPVEVTRYVERPYPVEVPVAHPVPYPVDRIVEKVVKQPYPVEVRVPIHVKVPVPVEKIVEKKVPVPHFIEKQVPVDRIVEKPIPHYIDRPYPVKVPVAVVPQSYLLPVELPKPYQPYLHYYSNVPKPPSQLTQHSQQVLKYTLVNSNHHHHQQQTQQQHHLYASPHIYAPTHSGAYLPPKLDPQQNNGYLPPPKINLATTNGYLPPPPQHDCDQLNSHTKSIYYTIKPDDYIGLLPPKISMANLRTYPRNYRKARSNFNSNLRLEYGFMPPLIPSQEVDENGKPIQKGEH